MIFKTLIGTLALALLMGCGVSDASIDEPNTDVGDDAAELSLACVLGSSCASVLPVLNAVSSKPGPNASKANTGYWVPSAPSGLNVPRTSVTASISGVHHERDDLAVWVSASADGKTNLSADELLLLEVRSSSGTVLDRLVLAGPAVTLADRTTAVPSKPSTWNAAQQVYTAAPVDIAPLLPKGRSLTLKFSVLNVTGNTSNAAVVIFTAPRAAPPVRRIADLFDGQARQALPRATAADIAKYFAPGAFTAPMQVAFMQRTRDCNFVTGCAPWRGFIGPQPGSIKVVQNQPGLPFSFNFGRNDAQHAGLTVAVGWNAHNVLLNDSQCLNAVYRGSEDTCFYFPFAETVVSPVELWAVTNFSTQPWNSGQGRTETQYAVYARFTPGEQPEAVFGNDQVFSVSW